MEDSRDHIENVNEILMEYEELDFAICSVFQATSVGAKNVCSQCGKQFTVKTNLYRHLKNIHQTEPPLLRKIKCPGENCSEAFSRIVKLRDHIQIAHEVVMECEELEFMTFNDFQLWRRQMESETGCSYVIRTSPKVSALGKKISCFDCHRSGYFDSKSENKRVLKGFQSKKIEGHCPSTIEVVEVNNKVKIKFFKTHFGHLSEVKKTFLKQGKRGEVTVSEGAENVCVHCWKRFRRKENLKRHLKTVHREELSALEKIKCPEGNCSKAFTGVEELENHTQIVREVLVECEELDFATFSESHSNSGCAKNICLHCGKQFTTKTNLNMHLRNVHKVEPSVLKKIKCPVENCNEAFSRIVKLRDHVQIAHEVIMECEELDFAELNEAFQASSGCAKNICSHCQSEFATKGNLNRHLIKVHQEEPIVLKKMKCPAENCSEAFARMVKLRDHIQIAHKVIIECQELDFPTLTDFQSWKKQMETETWSSYIVRNTPNITTSRKNISYFFNCHRSGHFNSKSWNKRGLRKLGSKKIGGQCPSAIEVIEESNKVKVKFFKTHFGHVTEVNHVFLRKDEREEIAAKLKAGIGMEEILEGIRSSAGSNFQRIHMICRRDLRNICRDFNITYKKPQ